jgi:galactokinase
VEPAGDPRQRLRHEAPKTARWFRAPGRVNLMGDHTDYNEGFVLPIAIELEWVVAADATSNGRVRARSLDAPGTVEVAADGGTEPRTVEPAWGRYVAGVVQALARRGARFGLAPTDIWHQVEVVQAEDRFADMGR